jgi:N-acetylneuraminic acid mutarotase
MVAYDISADRWRRHASLPIEVNHPGVTAHGGRLYLYGGNRQASGGTEPKSDRLYRYDPRRDRWKRLADAPSGRAAMAFVAIGPKLYAAGGYDSGDGQLRELAIYDIKRDRWRSGPDMPTGRNHVGAAALEGRMIVTGGRPGPVNGGLTTVESYDPRKRRWAKLPPLGTARSGHAAVTARGRLVVFGGEELIAGGTTIEEVEAFDPESRSWTELPPMITPRHGVGGAARRGRIYALEGGPSPGLAYSDALEYLDLAR